MSAARVLNVALLLGLGASLAICFPRRDSRAPSNTRGGTITSPVSESCYARVRREHPEAGGEPFGVLLTVGISGRVKHVAPGRPSPRFQFLLPCIREDAGRLTFPPADEEHTVGITISPAN
jgi:hypothetical protein